MTSVFSLSSQTQPKTRVRRKMTETEKIEYRKRRIVKACDKCAKRKRKCHHNQAQMETLSQKGASKRSVSLTNTPHVVSNQVSRSVTTSQRSKAPAAETQPPPPSSLADFSDDPFAFLSTDAAMTLTVLDETNSNFDFGDMVDFNFASQAPMSLAGETQPWPWSNTQDFTLIDAPLADLAAGNDLFYGVTEPLAPTHTFHAHAAQRPNATSVQESAAIYSRHNAYSDLVQGTVQTRTIANGTAQPLLQVRAAQTLPQGSTQSPLLQGRAARPVIQGPVESLPQTAAQAGLVRATAQGTSPQGLQEPIQSPSQGSVQPSSSSTSVQEVVRPERQVFQAVSSLRRHISSSNAVLSEGLSRSASLQGSSSSALLQGPSPGLLQVHQISSPVPVSASPAQAGVQSSQPSSNATASEGLYGGLSPSSASSGAGSTGSLRVPQVTSAGMRRPSDSWTPGYTDSRAPGHLRTEGDRVKDMLLHGQTRSAWASFPLLCAGVLAMLAKSLLFWVRYSDLVLLAAAVAILAVQGRGTVLSGSSGSSASGLLLSGAKVRSHAACRSSKVSRLDLGSCIGGVYKGLVVPV